MVRLSLLILSTVAVVSIVLDFCMAGCACALAGRDTADAPSSVAATMASLAMLFMLPPSRPWGCKFGARQVRVVTAARVCMFEELMWKGWLAAAFVVAASARLAQAQVIPLELSAG